MSVYNYAEYSQERVETSEKLEKIILEIARKKLDSHCL